MIRLFLAIPIHNSLATLLNNSLTAQSFQIPPQFHWSNPGNHHLTIRFIGNTEQEMLPKIIKVMHENILGIDQFEITINKIAQFPHSGSKIIAAYTELPALLHELQSRCESAIQQLGYPTETHDFIPHITLGKSKTKNQFVFQEILLPKIHFKVSSLTLYESHIQSKTLTYTPRYNFALPL